MDAHIDQNASEKTTENIEQQVEDFEVFDAFDLLNVCCYAVMSVSKYLLFSVLLMVLKEKTCNIDQNEKEKKSS